MLINPNPMNLHAIWLSGYAAGRRKAGGGFRLSIHQATPAPYRCSCGLGNRWGGSVGLSRSSAVEGASLQFLNKLVSSHGGHISTKGRRPTSNSPALQWAAAPLTWCGICQSHAEAMSPRGQAGTECTHLQVQPG